MAKTTSDVNYLTARRPRTGDPVVPDSVKYDNLNRVISVSYYVGFNNDIEVVNLSYNAASNLVFKNVIYSGMEIDVWNCTLVPISKINDAAAEQHTANELATIQLLGLSTNNMLTTNNDYDIITDNEGEILFSPTIS